MRLGSGEVNATPPPLPQQHHTIRNPSTSGTMGAKNRDQPFFGEAPLHQENEEVLAAQIAPPPPPFRSPPPPPPSHSPPPPPPSFASPNTMPADKMRERRFVSTPTSLPSRKKENLVPVGLMRPISPTRGQSQTMAYGHGQQTDSSSRSLPLRPLAPQPVAQQPSRLRQPTQGQSVPVRPALTKSRTVNALTNLRQSFGRSKSNLSLASRQSSFSSATQDPITDEDTSEFTPDNPGDYMFGAHETTEWLGRYTAIVSRLNGDSFQMAVEDGPAFQDHIRKVQAWSGKNYSELKKAKSDRKIDLKHCLSSANASNNFLGNDTPHSVERGKFMADDERFNAKRAMENLSTLCKDDDAKKSFIQFQTTYAKVKGMPELLPQSSMVEKFLGKVGTKFDVFKNKKSATSEQSN